MMRKIKDYSLYLVISEECGRGKSAIEIAREAISGDVDIIQMREKRRLTPELVKLGNRLRMLCTNGDVTFIVNDNPYLARVLEADGVHLGQEDIKRYSIPHVRDIVGPDRIIGISTHSMEQFAAANDEDIDYIAFGPIFPTKTKDYSIGTKDIGDVLKISKKPVVFIGGITLSNMDEIIREGGRNIALIRDILESDDIASRTREFKRRLAK